MHNKLSTRNLRHRRLWARIGKRMQFLVTQHPGLNAQQTRWARGELVTLCIGHPPRSLS